MKEVITRLIDDLDKSDADETVKFALDGVEYEIDLSDKNAAKLREALAPYVEAGTRLGRVGRVNGHNGYRSSLAPRTAPTRADKEQSKAIREWARSHGKVLGDKGRIPGDVVAAFEAKDATLMGVPPVPVKPEVPEPKETSKKAPSKPAEATKAPAPSVTSEDEDFRQAWRQTGGDLTAMKDATGWDGRKINATAKRLKLK